MDRETFLLLAPAGTRIISWAEPTDDGESFTVLLHNELVTADTPLALLTTPMRRAYFMVPASPSLRLAA